MVEAVPFAVLSDVLPSLADWSALLFAWMQLCKQQSCNNI